MIKDYCRDEVIFYLQQIGYRAMSIQESDKDKRADIFAECESDSIVIEVKSKADEKEVTLYQELVNSPEEQPISYQEAIERKDRITKILKEASKQIEETKIQYSDSFGVIWFQSKTKLGFSESYEQLKMNLYGGRYAFVDAPDGTGYCMQCFNTYYSDFYRFKNVDAVILDMPKGCQLLPNQHSQTSNKFQNTKLYEFFASGGAIWSPEIMQKEGTALNLSGSVDLKNISKVIQELEKQNPGYKIKTFVDMNAYGGIVKI